MDRPRVEIDPKEIEKMKKMIDDKEDFNLEEFLENNRKLYW